MVISIGQVFINGYLVLISIIRNFGWKATNRDNNYNQYTYIAILRTLQRIRKIANLVYSSHKWRFFELVRKKKFMQIFNMYFLCTQVLFFLWSKNHFFSAAKDFMR